MSKPPHTVSPEWGATLSKYTSHLRACARNYLNDPEAVNDLAQDAMVKALQHEHQFEPGSNMKAWLATIVRNHFISGYQRSLKYPHQTIDSDLHNDSGMFGCSQNEGEGELTIAELQHAMASIPEQYGDTIKLRVEGFKYEEIAQRLNIPIGTVKNRIHIAKHELIHFFKSKQHNPNRMQPAAQDPSVSAHVLTTSQPPLPQGISEQQHDCDIIIAHLIDFLQTDTFRYVDRDAMQADADVKRFTLDTCFPILVEQGYLEVEKQGYRKAYRLCGSMYALTARHLSELLDEKSKAIAQAVKDKAASEKANKPAKPAIDFFKNPDKAITSSPLIDEPTSKEQVAGVIEQTAPVAETPAEQKPVINTQSPSLTQKEIDQLLNQKIDYGFVQDGQPVWFSDREIAAEQATAYAIAERQTQPVDLLQRIGQVQVKPTVVFF